jgi:flagellar biosynthesis/type III secretory pathway M-ring protein FliF/YscJ
MNDSAFCVSEASSIKPVFGINMIPILTIIAAVIATIIIVAVMIVLVIRSRGHGGEDKRLPKNNGGFKANPEHDKSSAVPLKKSIDDMLETDDKNPDVVPHSSGTVSNSR